MARTNPTDVTETFDTDLPDSAVSDWIDIATEVVDDIAAKDSSITASRLEKIEKLVAQGYTAIQDPRIKNARRESAQVSYQRGENYPNDYFAAAVSLDPTGTVAGLFDKTASIDVPSVK